MLRVILMRLSEFSPFVPQLKCLSIVTVRKQCFFTFEHPCWLTVPFFVLISFLNERILMVGCPDLSVI